MLVADCFCALGWNILVYTSKMKNVFNFCCGGNLHACKKRIGICPVMVW